MRALEAYGPPLPTRLYSLVSLETANDVAHFRTAEDARGWGRRVYGPRWAAMLLLWDNIADREVAA